MAPARPREKRTPKLFFNGVQIACAAAFLLLASCTSSPRYRPPSRPPDASDSSRQPATPESVSKQSTSADAAPNVGAEQPDGGAVSDIVEHAQSFVGTPYRRGGASRRGMDCSGLVMRVYQNFAIDLPRRSIDQSRVGRTVSRTAVRPGDLVFFKTSNRNPVTHVGIYIGDRRFIHASTSARRVRIDSLDSDYFRRRFVVAKRVLD
jgi:cell wall-associated NlpC family hydrolase